MPRAFCVTCKHPTASKGYEEREQKCARCFHLSKLDPFDDAVAEQRIQQLYRDSDQFDKVLAAMRKTMRPPPGYEDWTLWQIVEFDSRRMKWGAPVA